MILDSKVGYSITIGNKIFFLTTSRQNKCKSVVDNFIKGICHYRELATGKSFAELCERALADEPTRKDIIYRLCKTEYEYRQIDETFDRYHYFKGDNFGESIPESERESIIFIEEES